MFFMENCIFCKIINQEIPSYKVYEDELVYAFLDISQVTKGHTLVIPKTHVTDLFDYDAQLASDLFSRIPKIAKAIEKAFPEMEGLNMVNNNKALAYQSVFHSHVHLIPRYSKNDDFSMHFGNHQADYQSDELKQIAETIAKQVETND
ncbi:histidine triad protein [Enterococcus phoeniculicola]|nr:histidine triad protein [Enterococcus phoeniculicola]